MHQLHGPLPELFLHDEPCPKASPFRGGGAHSAEHNDRRGIETLLVSQLGTKLPFKIIDWHIIEVFPAGHRQIDNLHLLHDRVEVGPSG